MKIYIKIFYLILLIISIIYYNYVTNKNNHENMDNIFLHSGPESNNVDNLNKMVNLTKVNYKNKKSVTGKFNELGGPDYSIESYKFNINSCNCPPFSGPKTNNIETSKNYKQIYPERLSPTAIFKDSGPLPNNEYNYDNFINGCDCPKYGVV